MKPNRYSRKEFLKLAGMSAAALALPSVGFPQKKQQVANIGFQLYTVRREIEKDFEGAIRKVARMGFLGVETYPLPPNATLQQAAAVFKKYGLTVFGMHTGLPVGEAREKVVQMAEIYQCKNVVHPGWPTKGEKYKNLDATKQTAESYNEAAAFLKTEGLRLGLHNHWWEFEKTDGIIPFYYLLEHLNADIFFELDMYWVKTGGLNPATVVGDFGKRAPFLHIKDGPAKKGDTMYAHVPAGTGSLNFPSIVKAGNENIQWMIVEFDEYAGDIFEGMQQSYTFLTKNGLAKGNV